MAIDDPSNIPQLIAEAHRSIASIPAGAWNACNPGNHPFTRHDFMLALEESSCIGEETGWATFIIVVKEQGSDDILGIAPGWLKTHSYGEFVFDWSWAEAYDRAGGRYYPKLLVAVPFTPVNGPRLLCKPGLRQEETRAALASAIRQFADQLKLSSAHVTFAEDSDLDVLNEAGFLQRQDQQFHWQDNDYGDFDGFLDALASRKRKAIKKERRKAAESGLDFEELSGDAITQDDWDAFYQFYMDTGARKWGRPYLNRDFFINLHARMGDNIVLSLARRDGQAVAGALHIKSDDCLYGRYWGCTEEVKFLHFEMCYYRAIDYALQHGLTRVEAGAQGGHKLTRGYMPHATRSAHYIADPGFAGAVERFLIEEKQAVEKDMEYLADLGPFKRQQAAEPADKP